MSNKYRTAQLIEQLRTAQSSSVQGQVGGIGRQADARAAPKPSEGTLHYFTREHSIIPTYKPRTALSDTQTHLTHPTNMIPSWYDLRCCQDLKL